MDPRNSSRGPFGFVVGLCVLAISAGLDVRPANAQGAGAISAVSAKPQKLTARASAAKPDIEDTTTRKSAGAYFVEFRSRTAASYGHTFVVHGRAGDGRIRASQVAGLHPAGTSPVTYVIGHVLPVQSETGASDGDTDEQYLTARYRVTLSEPQYARVAAYIKQLQASSPLWNAALYNCNAFARDIARFIGLRTPNIWSLPKDFINDLRRMNSRRQ